MLRFCFVSLHPPVLQVIHHCKTGHLSKKKINIKTQIHSITKTNIHMNVNFSCNQLHRKKNKTQTKYMKLDN